MPVVGVQSIACPYLTICLCQLLIGGYASGDVQPPQYWVTASRFSSASPRCERSNMYILPAPALNRTARLMGWACCTFVALLIALLLLLHSGPHITCTPPLAPCLHPGCSPATSHLHFSCIPTRSISAACELHSICIPPAFQLHLSCIPAASRLHRGCSSGVVAAVCACAHLLRQRGYNHPLLLPPGLPFTPPPRHPPP